MSLPAPASGPAPIEWSKKAIFGAVFAILGFATLWLVFGLFFAALAAILGHVARYECQDRGLRGRRFATFALWLSYFSMITFPVIALAIGLSFPAVEKWRADQETRHRAESRARASRLFVACEAYARANRDHYPDQWEALSGRFVPAEELAGLLYSPHPGGPRVAFEIVPHDRPVLEAIGDSVIVIQEIAPARVSEIAVVYANGRVAGLHNPDHEVP
jgi:MFS family permease